MLRFVVLTLAISSCLAYSAVKSVGLSAPLTFAAPLSRGFAPGSGVFAHSLPAAGPIPAAIQSTRSYEVIPVASNYEAAVPQTIEVGPNVQPLNFIFRTQSSPLNLQQVHTSAAPVYESTRSEDQPSVLTHENYRTVVQQYNEVIQPIRKIQQRVNPVIEHVNTVVSKGEQLRALPVAAPAYSANLAPLSLFQTKADY